MIRRLGVLTRLAMALWTFAAGVRAQEREARAILDAAGVTGGLIVHLGCGDGKLTAALRATDRFLVHGLDTDAAKVDKAREHIQSRGLYGPVSVEAWDGERLPYADNLVNLLVLENVGRVPASEVPRVLAPGGVALSVNPESQIQNPKSVKPWTAEMDEWTHFLHDASGNAVSRDALVGPPKHVQWVGGPTWARSHEHLAGVSALVSSAGRIFYIVDEGAIAAVTLPPSWFLVARDAFNGLTLWKRPIPSWAPHLREFRSGPPNLPRRLIALRDRVYVTLGYGAPLTALDAATGQTLRAFDGTEGTEEVILADGVLLVVVAKDAEKSIRAVEADSGKTLWQKQPQALAPLTLAALDGPVVYRDGQKVVYVDLKTGEPRWESAPTPTATRAVPGTRRRSFSTGT